MQKELFLIRANHKIGTTLILQIQIPIQRYVNFYDCLGEPSFIKVSESIRVYFRLVFAVSFRRSRDLEVMALLLYTE